MERTNAYRVAVTLAVGLLGILIGSCGFTTPLDPGDPGGDPSDNVPPQEVSSLVAIEGSRQIALSWTDPPDEDLASLEVASDPSGITEVLVDPGVEALSVTGLTNGTQYTLTVTAIDSSGNRSAGASIVATPQASTDSNLASLSIDGTPLAGFDPETSAYNLSRPEGTTSVTIDAEAADAAATVTGDTGTQSLTTGANVFEVSVTAEDGVTTTTYTVSVSVEASADAQLSDLTLDGTTVAGFSTGTYSYVVSLPVGTTSVALGAVAADSGASLSGTGTATVGPGRTELAIVVTAQDGISTATYAVAIEVAPATATGVTATDGTADDRITVSWNSVGGADSYRVYRRLPGAVFRTLIASVSATTYDDSSAAGASGTVYEYEVTAVADSIESAASPADTGYAGATVAVTISFDNPSEPSIGLAGSTTIAQGAALSVSAQSGFSSYVWYLDGEAEHAALSSSGANAMIDTSGFSIGTHTVALVVTDSTGSYSAQYSFTVQN